MCSEYYKWLFGTLHVCSESLCSLLDYTRMPQSSRSSLRITKSAFNTKRASLPSTVFVPNTFHSDKHVTSSDFRLAPWSRWDLRSSRILRSVSWQESLDFWTPDEWTDTLSRNVGNIKFHVNYPVFIFSDFNPILVNPTIQKFLKNISSVHESSSCVQTDD